MSSKQRRMPGWILSAMMLFGFAGVWACKAAAVGELAWSKTIRFVTTPVLSPGGTLVIATADSFIVGLDAATGKTLWQVQGDPREGFVRAPALSQSGIVIAGNNAGAIYAVNVVTGKLLWKFTETSSSYSGAAIDSADRMFYCPKGDHLRCLDVKTGKQLWDILPGNSRLDQSWFSMSPVLAEDGSVIIAAPNGIVYAFDPGTGSKLWEIKGTGRYDGPPAIGRDGTVYSTTLINSTLDALSPKTLKKLWAASLPGPITSSPVIGEDGGIYAGAWSKAFYKFSPAGSRLWSYNASGEIWGSALLTSDGLAYLFTSDGVLHALNSTNGAVSWKYDPRSTTPFKFEDLSPTLGPGGLIYIPSGDSTRILAIQSGSTEMANSSWPRYRRDNGNTGGMPQAPSGVIVNAEPYFVAGNPMKLTVEGRGGTPLNFQWLRNGVAIPGANGVTYEVAVSRSVEDSGDYQVQITNLIGQTNTPALKVQVLNYLPPIWGGFSPADGATGVFPVTTVSCSLTNRGSHGVASTVRMIFNGNDVSTNVVVRESADGLAVSYQPPFLTRNQNCTVEVVALDDSVLPVTIRQSWKFQALDLPVITPDYKLATSPSTTPGFTARAVQTADGVAIGNGLAEGEKLLAANPSPQLAFSNVVVVPTINFRTTGSDPGFFTSPLASSLQLSSGSRSSAHAIEFTGYLELSPGLYKVGGHVDDGFQLNVSPGFKSGSGLLLGTGFDGSVGEKVISFVVVERGYYPFRIPYWNWSLGLEGWLELYTIDQASGKRTLIGASGQADAVKVFANPLDGINAPPKLADVGNQAMDQDTTLGPLPLVITDPDTPASAIRVTARSSDQVLIPDGRVVVSTVGSGWTLTVTPASGRSGEASITLTVSDGIATTTSTFLVTVRRVGIPLGFAGLTDQVIDEDKETALIPFTIRGVDANSTSLSVTAVSAEEALLPSGGIVLGGGGTNRTIRLKPAADHNGPVRVDVRADDGFQKATASFVLNVLPVNDPPSLRTPPVLTIAQIESISVSLPAFLSDVDLPKDSHRYTLLKGPAGVLVDASTGMMTWSPGLATSPGSYSLVVRVTDSGGTGLSAQAEQIVEVRKSLFLPQLDASLPLDRTNRLGDPAKFEIFVNGGTEPMTVQWEFNGVPIAGQTNRVLELAAVVPAQAGLYSATVQNEVGSVRSRAARLTVLLDSPNLPPSVRILSPADLQVFSAASSVPFYAVAEDPDGVVQSVAFLEGNRVLGSATNRPFRMELKLQDPGLHVVTAVATDNRGASSRSESVTLELVDAVGLPSISVDNPVVIEGTTILGNGEVGTEPLVFTLRLSAASTVPVLCSYKTEDGTATAGSDYRSAEGTVVFQPGEMEKKVSVDVLSDSLPDGDTPGLPGSEVFYLNLFNLANAVPVSSQAIGIIVDDEIPNQAFFESATVRQAEGNRPVTQMIFRVKLAQPAAQLISVDYETVNGSALAGRDYLQAAGRLVFQPGQSVGEVRIAVIGDSVHQGSDRSFQVRLSNASNVQLIDGKEAATGVIVDDDGLPVVTVEGGSVKEGDSGSSELLLKVSLSEPAANPITMSYRTVAATAVEGVDFIGARGQISIASGLTNGTITVRILGNRMDQSDRFFKVLLEDPVGATLGVGEATVTILDDDSPPVLSIKGATINEGNQGTTQVVLGVTLSEASENTVSVDYRTVAGTAVEGVDYVGSRGVVTFAPGATNSTVAIRVNANTLDQPDREFRVLLENPKFATISSSEATVTILDDDAPPMLAIKGASINEGNQGTSQVVLGVTLSEASENTVSVDYRTVAGTAVEGVDYVGSRGVVTFAPGVTNSTLAVRVNANTLDQPDREFGVLLENPKFATIGSGEATVTILDDDLPPSLTLVPARVLEGGPGTTNIALLPLILSTASGREIRVDYLTRDGTAMSGRDFVPIAGTVVFAPGVTTNTVRIPILGDALDEDPETFQIELTNPVAVQLTNPKSSILILDDDDPPIVQVSNLDENEGSSGERTANIELKLSSPSELPVSLLLTSESGTAEKGADFRFEPVTISFAPGETRQVARIIIIGDSDPEPDEQFLIQLSNPVHATLESSSIKVTLRNDDQVRRLPPTLAVIEDHSVTMNGTLRIPLDVRDPDSAVPGLVVGAVSDSPALYSAGGVLVQYDGNSWVVTLSPVVNAAGTATISVSVSDGEFQVSRSFKVSVVQTSTPPRILVHPQSRNVLVGTTVELRAGVSGSEPLFFQWRLNGTNLPAATNAALVLPGIQISQAGRYSLQVTNSAGTILSDEASLLVGKLGAKLWDFATEGQIFSSAALSPDGRTILIGSDDGRLRAIRRDGTLLWSFQSQGGISGSPAVSPEGIIYFGSKEGIFHALGLDGVERWRFEIGAGMESTPGLGADGTVYFGAQDNQFRALSPDGKLRWSFTTSGLIYSSPAVAQDGTIYFGSYDRKLYALSANGEKRWEYESGAAISSSPAIASDGAICFGSADGFLHALNPDGSRRWRFSTGNGISSSPVIARDGTIYFGSEDGRFHALSSAGVKKWEFSTRIPIYSTAALGSDGTIYFGGFDNTLYALNSNGTRRWEYAAGGPIYGSPLVDSDGVVYFGSLDKKIYAIQGTTPLADSPWPMFRRDPSHIGLVPRSNIPEPPLLGLAGLDADGSAILTIVASQPGRFVVETSENLQKWTALETVSVAPPSQRYVDRSGSRFAARFYRLRNDATPATGQ